jgi:hypothetical protein
MNQEKVERALAHYTGEAQLAALASALRILDREQTRECELAAARCRQAILDASGRGE